MSSAFGIKYSEDDSEAVVTSLSSAEIGVLDASPDNTPLYIDLKDNIAHSPVSETKTPSEAYQVLNANIDGEFSQDYNSEEWGEGVKNVLRKDEENDSIKVGSIGINEPVGRGPQSL
ncbi:MAG: hypothetical protein ABEJ83_05365 [Candidatus Nanohaloarchaea archaeon]